MSENIIRPAFKLAPGADAYAVMKGRGMDDGSVWFDAFGASLPRSAFESPPDADPDGGPQIHGFAYVMREDNGREFLAVQTFGTSRTKAKNAMRAMNDRRLSLRKPALQWLRVCDVSIRVTAGQPPVDNRFVAEGCELFGERA